MLMVGFKALSLLRLGCNLHEGHLTFHLVSVFIRRYIDADLLLCCGPKSYKEPNIKLA